MQEDEPGVRAFFLRPKLYTFHLYVLRQACLDIGIDGGIRQRRNGDATRKSSSTGADLIQSEGSEGRYHCGYLFSTKVLCAMPFQPEQAPRACTIGTRLSGCQSHFLL